MIAATDLAEELKTYEAEKARLLADNHGGKHVVIGGGQVVGVYDTYEDALQVGYQKFGLARPFLVKKIEGIESVLYFTRDVTCQP